MRRLAGGTCYRRISCDAIRGNVQSWLFVTRLEFITIRRVLHNLWSVVPISMHKKRMLDLSSRKFVETTFSKREIIEIKGTKEEIARRGLMK